MTTPTAFPLSWPSGWPRAKWRDDARFKVEFRQSIEELQAEVERLGGSQAVLSTNLPRRLDGAPKGNEHPKDGDPGVAVYFLRNGKQMVFACDKWKTVKDNIRAIQRTIEAIRGIERWGASDLMERSLQAFEALPPPKTPSEILGVASHATPDEIRRAFRSLAREAHPDHGGSTARMAEIIAARDQLLGGGDGA